MPQMSPINWLSMFFIMCLTFLMFNLLNYFSLSINNNNNYKKKNYSNNNFNWKW